MKKVLKEKAARTNADKEVFALEYGYAKWLMITLDKEGILSQLKNCFPDLWQFIIAMVSDMEQAGLQYIIPLRRDNKLIPYDRLSEIDQNDNYFSYAKRHIFYANPTTTNERTVACFWTAYSRSRKKMIILNVLSQSRR